MSGKQNFTISLNNIIVYGFHGVHQEEKTLGQRFEIDLEYRLSNPPFPWKDEERATVSYVNAHKIVSRVCAEKSFNLIETLGKKIIHSMERFSPKSVTVTIHKPQTRMSKYSDDISVSLRHSFE